MCAVWSCPRIHVVSERNGQLRAALRLPRYLLDARRCTREVLDTFAPYGKGRAGRKGAPHTGRAGVGCSESPWRAVLSLSTPLGDSRRSSQRLKLLGLTIGRALSVPCISQQISSADLLQGVACAACV